MLIKNETANAPIKDHIDGNHVDIPCGETVEINDVFGNLLLKKYPFLTIGTEVTYPVIESEVTEEPIVADQTEGEYGQT